MSSPTLKGSDVLNFGKHKGKLVAWVAVNDSQYILWLIREKIKKFDVEVADWLTKNPLKVRCNKYCGGWTEDRDWVTEYGCDDGIDVYGLGY